MFGILGAYTGQVAGVTTSVLWTATSLQFTAAGKRISPAIVNATRIAFAVVLLAVTHRLLFGTWLPPARFGQVLFLAISGVVGLSLGDQALFVAFVDIGPRLSMLIMTTAPLFAALFGWVALGETLEARAWLGVLVTIGGVAWVVLEKPKTQAGLHPPHRVRGVILAFIAAACQAAGLWLSKQGMGHGWLPKDEHLDPQAATLVRMVFAAVGMIPILALHLRRERRRRNLGLVTKRIGSPRAGLLFACSGAVCGPYLGVWMSLVASDHADLGVAQTLCSLPPVFLLPFAILIHKEHVSPRAALGAVLAVAGVGLLFWQTG